MATKENPEARSRLRTQARATEPGEPDVRLRKAYQNSGKYGLLVCVAFFNIFVKFMTKE